MRQRWEPKVPREGIVWATRELTVVEQKGFRNTDNASTYSKSIEEKFFCPERDAVTILSEDSDGGM
jgi:hypothetical protein